jgi:predicted methyltransferase
MNIRFAAPLAALLLVSPTAFADEPPARDAALAKAVESPVRDAQSVARDIYRHPEQELEFFGIAPTMRVVEIWPAPGYWTEILAPYLRDKGAYIAALPPSRSGEMDAGPFMKMLGARKPVFGNVQVASFGEGRTDIAPPGTADMVLTFRNLHNWMGEGWGDAAMAAFYKALKPGGILGIEDHRGRADRPQDPRADNGYVRQDYTIAMAEKAGFKFVEASEINANPKDTKDWPAGVWTLPPTLALGARNRDKYLAIGEADNYVLKFRKPAN